MKYQKRSQGDSATAEELQKMIDNKKHIKDELLGVKEKVQNFESKLQTIEQHATAPLTHSQTFGRESKQQQL